jgi:hypothetical protein
VNEWTENTSSPDERTPIYDELAAAVRLHAAELPADGSPPASRHGILTHDDGGQITPACIA